MITGQANTEATAGYFNSRGELGGWLDPSFHCSRVGFGGYRVDDETPAFAEALKTALLSGCNLIDTSTNYTDGGSERLVGECLAELIQVGVLDREQVIVVSKVGYVQGQALEWAKKQEALGKPIPDMVKYQDACWHCIHPEFIGAQLEKSLERLGLSCIDFYLLHNPEYFLMDLAKRGNSAQLSKTREQFYARVQRAFAFLETQVAAGKIQGYGVSSNTVGAPADRADSTSLSHFFEAAQAVSSKHHFQVIQLPLNLYESGPYLEKNTGENQKQTALEFASKNRLAVLVNRPLNAFTQSTLVRLADFAVQKTTPNLREALSDLADIESEFQSSIAPIHWAQELSQIENVPISADRWSQIEDQISAHVTQAAKQISQHQKDADWDAWFNRYAPALQTVLELFRNESHKRSQKVSARVSSVLDPLLPDEWKSASLSQKALGVLIHTPGVSCVLNGMRRADYVHDSMQATKLPRLDAEKIAQIYASFTSSDA